MGTRDLLQRQPSLVSGSFYQELLRYGSNQSKAHLSYRPLGKISQPSHYHGKNSVPIGVWVRSGFSHRHPSVWSVNAGCFRKLTSHASPLLLLRKRHSVQVSTKDPSENCREGHGGERCTWGQSAWWLKAVKGSGVFGTLSQASCGLHEPVHVACLVVPVRKELTGALHLLEVQSSP